MYRIVVDDTLHPTRQRRHAKATPLAGNDIKTKPSATEPSAWQRWACGPGLIVLSTFLQLAPKFVVSNSLLVSGRSSSELVLRKALVQALAVSLFFEMVWTAARPQGVTMRWAGGLLLVSTGLSALSTALSFAGQTSYNTPQLAFLLQAVAGCCSAPVSQVTAQWRLTQSRSPAQWRMVGWILSVGFGTVALLQPTMAAAGPTLILTAGPPLLIALALGSSESLRPVHKTAGSVGGGQTITVSGATAAHYVVLAVVLGTNAEAVCDMAVGLRVRESLVQGTKDLALTNNVSVLASQLLALLSDGLMTKLSNGSERRRSFVFLSLWSTCQLMRGACMPLLAGSSVRAQSLLATFVFFDKYTGPFGQAALDTAAVALLQAKALPKLKTDGARALMLGLSVPAPFLISLRAASFKYERPMWEMLLLQEEQWPLPLTTVVVLLVAGVFTGVVYSMQVHHRQ